MTNKIVSIIINFLGMLTTSVGVTFQVCYARCTCLDCERKYKRQKVAKHSMQCGMRHCCEIYMADVSAEPSDHVLCLRDKSAFTKVQTHVINK